MKAITYSRFGDLNVLQTVDEPQPVAQADQVLVHVKAVSLNPLDWKIRKGEMRLMSGSTFPKHTGTDFAGIVERVGSSVTHVEPGDEVFGVVKNGMKEGALAEYVAVAASHVWKKPTSLEYAQAASIPTVGAAAVAALEKMGPLQAGTQVLVNGATGGFGMFLLQLLSNTDATITAVTSTNALELANAWGADRVIDYKKENVLSQQATYDVVIDLSGKMGYRNAKRILKRRARFINVIPQPADILASWVNNWFTGKKHLVLLSGPSSENMNRLIKAIDDGLQVEVSKTFPFAQAKEAYQYAERGGYVGKVAVTVA
ncbi:NAD(P)-dependent alcohol dehydrogenase [Catalinimonas alkaloidigena]|nr:NAD(P)-dependent alcohol dehydrogenase [Catalinimonas alkaloidigena]